MPTTNKSLEQPAVNSTNWDVPLNANFGYIDSALGATTSKSVTGVTATPVVLTDTEYRSLILNFTGTLTANVTYQIPSGVGGEWIVQNNTSGAFTLTIDNVAVGTSVSVPSGGKALVYSDGTNINLVDPVLPVRAWVNFDASSGATVIRTSFNVTSVTYIGVGNFTVNFTTSFADTNYMANITYLAPQRGYLPYLNFIKTNSFSFQTVALTVSSFDPTYVYCTFYR
jgi:hypothetical protein